VLCSSDTVIRKGNRTGLPLRARISYSDGLRRLLCRCDLIRAVPVSAKNIVRLALGWSRSRAEVWVHAGPMPVSIC